MSPDPREAFLVSVEEARPDLGLLERLLDCHEVIPDEACDMLAVTRGTTYAGAAALLRGREARRDPG